MNNRLNELETSLEYHFRDTALLVQALTHPSLGKGGNYQRLEFLGDAVLGLMVAKLLYAMYPDEAEGDLAKRHAGLVCGTMLAEVAGEMKLAPHIRMTEGELAGGGQQNPSNLEDVCEAVIGAVFMDGGWDAAEQLVERYWRARALSVTAPPSDAKTALQEWAQGRGLPLPAYAVVASEGPAHAPLFTVSATVETLPAQLAEGHSKREAEQAAAALMLAYIEAQHD